MLVVVPWWYAQKSTFQCHWRVKRNISMGHLFTVLLSSGHTLPLLLPGYWESSDANANCPEFSFSLHQKVQYGKKISHVNCYRIMVCVFPFVTMYIDWLTNMLKAQYKVTLNNIVNICMFYINIYVDRCQIIGASTYFWMVCKCHLCWCFRW